MITSGQFVYGYVNGVLDMFESPGVSRNFLKPEKFDALVRVAKRKGIGTHVEFHYPQDGAIGGYVITRSVVVAAKDNAGRDNFLTWVVLVKFTDLLKDFWLTGDIQAKLPQIMPTPTKPMQEPLQ